MYLKIATKTNFKYVAYYIISLIYKISLNFSLLGVFRFSNNFLDVSYIFIIITLKSLFGTQLITNTLLQTWT